MYQQLIFDAMRNALAPDFDVHTSAAIAALIAQREVSTTLDAILAFFDANPGPHPTQSIIAALGNGPKVYAELRAHPTMFSATKNGKALIWSRLC